jgi:predicted metal-binding membrane protein
MDLAPVSPRVIDRAERVLLVGATAAVTATAWLWMIRAAGSAGAHAGHVPPSPHGTFWYGVLMWQAMTIAMMTPVVPRWIVAASAFADPGGTARLRAVLALAGGYFAAWFGYSAIAAGAQSLLQSAGSLDVGAALGGRAGGAVLVAAGLFQLTPLKRACLAHCRTPAGSLLTRWRNGPAGGFRIGLGHGAYCVACCWALMATAFALGVMNLAWMAVLTIVVAVEQLAPRGDRIGRMAGLAIAGWGLIRIAG